MKDLRFLCITTHKRLLIISQYAVLLYLPLVEFLSFDIFPTIFIKVKHYKILKEERCHQNNAQFMFSNVN